MLALSGQSPWLTKLVLISNFLENYCNAMQYMIFQYGWEPVLIHTGNLFLLALVTKTNVVLEYSANQ